MSEFDIITQYFAAQHLTRPDVIVGIGDDAALVKPLSGHELAITTDTLISGVHFPESSAPFDIGYKSLAVNLSDLAAMGATPAWVTMALTLPEENKEWIQAFCDGFFTLAKRYNVQLIGGDLTHGQLTITVQAMGFTPPQQTLLRSKAKPGDLIYVTGTLGDAGLALRFIQKNISLHTSYQEEILAKLNRPEPRIAVGEYLRSIATSAIDISDGLAADLTHILDASRVGASINVNQLPLSPAVKQTLSSDDAIVLALTAGDDYELCFTIPAQKRSELEKNSPCTMTCIGEITTKPGLELRYNDGSNYHGPILGYQHF